MDEIIAYPLVEYDDLTIDERYLELQKVGPVRVQLHYGEPARVATSYEDVKTVYGDRRFGKAIGVGRDTPRMFATRIADDPNRLDNMDPPQHTRVRRLALGAFSPQRVEKLRSWVEEMADEHLDSLAAAGPGADWEEHFAWNIPLRAISGILGVSEEDIPRFRGWVDDMVGVDTSMERRIECHGLMVEYVRGLVAERRETPRGDLLSDLVEARDQGDRLSEDELVNLAMNLFLGGFETTAAQIGSMAYTLTSQRELYEELVADRSLVPAALEELWRWIPSFRHGKCMVRWANEDVELSHGVVVPAGTCVVPEHQVANRDESAFPDAQKIDFHREDPLPHLSLAWGSHRCMGANLAHLEVEVTLTKLLDRFPTLELAVPADQVKWSSHTFLRSPESLPLKW